MAKPPSFLERVNPFAERERVMEWPFAVSGGDRPRLRLRVLGADELEAACLATEDHFRSIKKKVARTDALFDVRERVEIVWRGVDGEVEVDGKPVWRRLEDSADALAKWPPELLAEIYREWSKFSSDVTTRPLDDDQMRELVEDLKKKPHSVPLRALPSSWLIALCRTLAFQLAGSTPDGERG